MGVKRARGLLGVTPEKNKNGRKQDSQGALADTAVTGQEEGRDDGGEASDTAGGDGGSGARVPVRVLY